MSDTDILVVDDSWAGIQRVAETPKPASYFDGRKGYVPEFLGADAVVNLPRFTAADADADISKLADGSSVLKYQHFSVVQCITRKMPFFSACNIDGAKSKNVPRSDTWCYDGRIPKHHQILRDPYGRQQDKKFSRGHMTRRLDPTWGTFAIAERANVDTFFAPNACPQWQPFNDGIWGDLEDYILKNAEGDDKKVSVFTGPFFTDEDPERFGVLIPRDFWKVVTFISEQTGSMAAIGYVMSQGKYLDSGVAQDLQDFELSQRPIAYIEEHSGLRFDDLAGLDVLEGADLTFIKPILRVSDTRLPEPS